MLRTGKIDRKALPAPEWQSEIVYIAPRSPLEETLAEIWANVLGVERVGIHDDFFNLGGHSLIAMQVVSRIIESMQVQLPIDALFNAPSVAALAESLERSRDSEQEAPTITPITRSSRRAQRRRRMDDGHD